MKHGKVTAYTYKADMWCPECGQELCEKLECPGDPEDTATYDSSNYPKPCVGPWESDTPYQCAGCERFLEHELTEEGYDYVKREAAYAIRYGGGPGEVMQEWLAYYDIDLSDIPRPLEPEDVGETTGWEQCPECGSAFKLERHALEEVYKQKTDDPALVRCPICPNELNFADYT
ncbi:MAG: hypothetical protein ABEN55_21070 [Bradymonadaceae bacterium]